MNYFTPAAVVAASAAGFLLLDKPDHTLPTLEEANLTSFTPIDDSSTEIHGILTDQKEIIEALRAKKQAYIQLKVGDESRIFRVDFDTPPHFDSQDITVSCFGYSNNGNPYAWTALKTVGPNLGNRPMVVFDNPCNNDRRRFNFCSTGDQHILHLVLSKVTETNPDAQFTLFGGCQGSANMLTYLARNHEMTDPIAQKIRAVIAESPPISVRDAISSYPAAHAVCSSVLPLYRAQNDKVSLLEFDQWPRQVKILIASLPLDKISKLPQIKQLVGAMRTSGCEVTHAISGKSDLMHGKLAKDPDFHERIVQFRESAQQ